MNKPVLNPAPPRGAPQVAGQGFEPLLEALPAGAYLCDRDGLITYHNRLAADLWGRKPKLNDKADRYCGSFKLFACDGRPIRHDQCWMARALRDNKQYNARQIIIEKPTGQRAIVLAHANPIHDSDGKLVGAVNILVDITQQKRTERQLAQLDRTLEHRVRNRTARLSALAGELTRAEERERRRLARVLHDHLQQLLVAAKLRADKLAGRNPDPQAPNPAAHLADLIGRIIEATRTLTAELSPPILYERGLGAALGWLARWMPVKHGLTVHLEVDDDAEPQAQDMRVLLFVCARELLFNVAKHAATDRAQVRLSLADEDTVSLVVEDQGRGCDHAALHEPQTPGGFGLLSIRERLTLAGGRMTIDAAAGRGVTVCLHAPRDPSALHPQAGESAGGEETYRLEADGSPAGEGEGSPRPTIRVMLVDDHAIMRDGLALVLDDEPDMQLVGQASDGQAALDVAPDVQPDVIVMDITMPRLNGIDATRQLKKIMPGVKVVGLSLHEEQDMAAAMLQAGAEAYLTKGGAADGLIQTIRRVYRS